MAFDIKVARLKPSNENEKILIVVKQTTALLISI